MNDQTLQILLVDSEENSRELLAAYLRQQHSYEVEAVAAYDQALEHVIKAQRPYDVVLIDDLVPPQVGEPLRPIGLQLMQRIHAKCPHTAAILFRDKQFQRPLEVSLHAGAFRYLPKECDWRELAVLIREARAYQRQKGERHILEHIRKINISLLSGNNVDEVLRYILQAICGSGFDRVWLYGLSDDKRYLHLQDYLGVEQGSLKQAFPSEEDQALQMLLMSPQARIFDYQEFIPGHFLEPWGDKGQWACAPLMVRGEVIGTLSVASKADYRFSENNMQR